MFDIIQVSDKKSNLAKGFSPCYTERESLGKENAS